MVIWAHLIVRRNVVVCEVLLLQLQAEFVPVTLWLCCYQSRKHKRLLGVSWEYLEGIFGVILGVVVESRGAIVNDISVAVNSRPPWSVLEDVILLLE